MNQTLSKTVHEAVRSCNLHLLEQILEETPSLVSIEDEHGNTPLMTACEQGRLPLIEFLLDNGAEVNLARFDGFTPLMKASDEGHAAVVRFLVDQGADVHSSDQIGETPLVCACRYGHSEVVKLLLSRDVDINRTCGAGKTALMEACTEGHLTVVEYLLDHKADVNKQDAIGRTALMYAVQEDHRPIAMLLLNRGADPTLYDQFDKTVLDLNRNKTVWALLKPFIERRLKEVNERKPADKQAGELVQLGGVDATLDPTVESKKPVLSRQERAITQAVERVLRKQGKTLSSIQCRPRSTMAIVQQANTASVAAGSEVNRAGPADDAPTSRPASHESKDRKANRINSRLADLIRTGLSLSDTTTSSKDNGSATPSTSTLPLESSQPIKTKHPVTTAATKSWYGVTSKETVKDLRKMSNIRPVSVRAAVPHSIAAKVSEAKAREDAEGKVDTQRKREASQRTPQVKEGRGSTAASAEVRSSSRPTKPSSNGAAQKVPVSTSIETPINKQKEK